jgi:hypothetical protein
MFEASTLLTRLSLVVLRIKARERERERREKGGGGQRHGPGYAQQPGPESLASASGTMLFKFTKMLPQIGRMSVDARYLQHRSRGRVRVRVRVRVRARVGVWVRVWVRVRAETVQANRAGGDSLIR